MDSYAQDLRTLFYRAYPQAQQGTQETEQMACTMLANQFAIEKLRLSGRHQNLRKLHKLMDLGNPTSNLMPTKQQPSPPRCDRTGQITVH